MLLIVKHLERLRNNLREMTASLTGLIESVISGFNDRGTDFFYRISQEEERLFQLSKLNDESCVELLAVMNPMASDLRYVVSVIKLDADLLRMAQECRGIAADLRVLDEPVPDGVIQMAEMVRELSVNAFQALHDQNTGLAKAMISLDKKVDGSEAVLLKLAGHSIHLSMIIKRLERIADHGKNICESVVFSVEGYLRDEP